MNFNLENFALLAAYILISKAVLLKLKGSLREITFLLINISAVAYVFFLNIGLKIFTVYVALISLHYLLLRNIEKKSSVYKVALGYPIFLLFFCKYLPSDIYTFLNLSKLVSPVTGVVAFVGLSYVAFRATYMTMEVKNNIAPMPTFPNYLSFNFFLPTFSVGPISKYSQFTKGLDHASENIGPLKNSFFRIIIGLVKFNVIAPIFSMTTFSGLILDGAKHPGIDLLIAGSSFYVYLYANFSGFCDVMIGLGGLLGFKTDENFDNPFNARNIQDFWNKWHITLNIFMRDLVFNPLSKVMIRNFGVKHSNISLTFVIFVVFVAIGLWHGSKPRFVIFGIIHAIGVAAAMWWGIFLRKRLGRDKYKLYLKNTYVKWIAITLTFLYVSFSFAVFDNTLDQLQKIFSNLGCN